MEAKGGAQAAPTEASPAKRLRTCLWVGAAKKGAQLLAGSSWEEMSLRSLWSLADKTPGMRSKKTGRRKVGEASEGGVGGSLQSISHKERYPASGGPQDAFGQEVVQTSISN